jgi:transcriptional regulator with XRE-family HTH domain
MLKGSQICRVRKALGLKPAELSAAMGIATGTLRRWERSGDATNAVGIPLHLLSALWIQVPRLPSIDFTSAGDRVRREIVLGGTLRALDALLFLALQSPPAFPPTQTATGGTPTAATSPALRPRRSRAS